MQILKKVFITIAVFCIQFNIVGMHNKKVADQSAKSMIKKDNNSTEKEQKSKEDKCEDKCCFPMLVTATILTVKAVQYCYDWNKKSN
jgi:hypothetical protein